MRQEIEKKGALAQAAAQAHGDLAPEAPSYILGGNVTVPLTARALNVSVLHHTWPTGKQY